MKSGILIQILSSGQDSLLVESDVRVQATCWSALQRVVPEDFLQAAILPDCICQCRTIYRYPAIISIGLHIPLRALWISQIRGLMCLLFYTLWIC